MSWASVANIAGIALRALGMPQVDEAIKKFRARGYDFNNPPPMSEIDRVMQDFNVGREEIQSKLSLLDSDNKLTRNLNRFVPGGAATVKEFANGYLNSQPTNIKGDTGNSAVTHNTITGRRKLPKIR